MISHKNIPTAPSIHLKDLSFSFPGAELFRSLSFSIAGGKWTCLLGTSGCGKSTLLRLISGSLRREMTGEITYDNGNRGKISTAWMAQKDLLLPWMPVLENVLLGHRLRGNVTHEKRETALTLIKKAGLGDYAQALPSALSGGMRQRVALMRTLMEERSIILMDEPFSALDALTRLKLQDLAADMVKGATVLLVTHDPLEALRLGHHIHVMSGRPVQMSNPLIPPGKPPRKPGDSEIAVLHQTLLDRLVESIGS